jgi:uncharacterized protein (UPF0332 family)
MFDPRQYLSLAASVLATTPDEAALRSAVSRAYYAAFLVAREYVDDRGIRGRSRSGRRLGSHERVIFSIGAVPDELAITMRNRLFRLKRLRTSVDYDLDYADVELTVSDALDDAERLIAWVDGLP